MYVFKEDDTVSFVFNRKEYHGTIEKINTKTADVWINDLCETKKLSLSRLNAVPPIILTNEQIRKLCRYEIKWSDIIKENAEYAPVLFEQPYTITFDDIITAVKNIHTSSDSNKTVRSEWYYLLYDFMFESEVELIFENTPDDAEMIEYLPTRADIISHLFFTVLDDLTDIQSDPIAETILMIQKQLENIISDEKKIIVEREYDDEDKEHFISALGNDDRLKTATSLELTVYRKFVDELIQKDNITALRCKGYGCYGGDPAYECDWNTALECVTKLYKLTGKSVYANTLGYIYYYGRCWNGEPKYDEAFKYFSIGAAGFNYESRYKLADMFVHGYGVTKNTKIANTIITELYDQNLSYILDGKFECKFADIALRLGNYTENGYGGYTSYYNAYKYYLQADFAIRQRLQYNHYGDLSVADSIRQRLNNIIGADYIRKPKKTSYVDLRELLEHHLKKYRKLQLKIITMKNGDIRLAIRIAPFENEKYPPKLFITETDTGFCGMLETLNIRAKNGKIIEPKNIDVPIYFDSINTYYEPVLETNGIAFMLGDGIQAII